MWRGISKRRFPRVDCHCLIRVSKKGSRKQFVTNTENIGVGGICVTLDDSLQLFDGVELELTLQDGESPVKCTGSIVWIVKSGELKNGKTKTRFDTGVEFKDISEPDKIRIEKLIDSILQVESKRKGGINK